MSEAGERLIALRGATTVESNESAAILAATEELLAELMRRNTLRPELLVSIIFTCTEDLDAAFPAEAARRIGLNQVPLLCSQEIAVPGALGKVIRLLAHCHLPGGHEPQHVYLRGAVALRSDLAAPQ